MRGMLLCRWYLLLLALSFTEAEIPADKGFWGKGGDFTDNKVDLQKVVKKKKQRKLIFKTAVFLLIVLIIVFVALNWKKIIEPFRDAGLSLGKGGFPITLPGSATYVMDSMGDNLYLLTDTYFYTFNTDGAQIAGIQHGFQNPSITSGEKRALVYDKNGKGFKVYSRSAEVSSETLEDTIVFAEMGKNEHFAVITTAARYFNYLYVFNDEGKQVFRYASPTEKIMQACFSDNENFVYISAVGEKNGELESRVLCFDITKEQDAVWSENIGNVLPYSLEYCSDGVYCVTEKGSVLLDKSTGERLKENSFSENVTGISKTDGARYIFFRDTALNGQTAVIYDSDLASQNSRSFSNISSYDISGGVLYVLSGNKLYAYSNSLNDEKEYSLDDDYSDVKIIGRCAYLLGYNTVGRIEL